MKPKALIRDCNGEAHENPHIDNCWLCAPFWGRIVLCPIHDNTKLSHSGYCKKCRSYYEVGK